MWRDAYRGVGAQEGPAIGDQDEGFRIIRVQAQFAHEVGARHRLDRGEPEQGLPLVLQDEVNRVGTQVADPVKDDELFILLQIFFIAHLFGDCDRTPQIQDGGPCNKNSIAGQFTEKVATARRDLPRVKLRFPGPA